MLANKTREFSISVSHNTVHGPHMVCRRALRGTLRTWVKQALGQRYPWGGSTPMVCSLDKRAVSAQIAPYGLLLSIQLVKSAQVASPP
jgi:hypothetical protein